MYYLNEFDTLAQSVAYISIESLRQVAAEGVQTTSLSSLVETFLSVTPLQTIPVTDTECRLSGSLLECADNSQAITALDLAFTFGTTFQHSASLLDVACRHCDRLQGDSKKSLGFVGFSRNMIHLLKEANMESDEPRGELPSNISVNRLLGCSYLPLSVRQLREHKQFWKELDDSLRQFQLALEQSEGAAHSPSCSTRMNEFHEAKPHVAFKRLLRVFANNVLYKDSDGPSYLYYLYIYLKSLSSLLVQFLPETDKQIPRTYFDILGESVVSIIGRLVFDHDVPPSQLEGVTSKLKLDLVQLVIQNCCPVIPDTPPPLPYQGAASNEWGRILLNKAGMEKNGEARHPELCVRTLLSDLLTLINDNLESSSGVLTVERATRLANDSNVQALLASTSEIVAVDLTLLSPGVETLAFLANLTNLMWIHALLTLEISPREVEGGSSDTNFGLVSKSAMCRLMSMQCVGYTVGALGFVSLFELLNTLLGPDLALSLPSLLRSVAQHGRSTHHEDLWDRFTVSSDPRFLFALTNGHKYSPKVQVLHANNMDEQLDRCMVEYVNHFIAVEVMESGTRLLIPPLIQSYHEFVLVNQEPESHTMMPDLLDREDSSSISRREKFSLLLEFLRDNSSGERRSRLYDSVHSLTSSNMVVSLKSSYVFSITLEYTNGNGVEISAAEALLADTEEDMWDKRVLQEPVVNFLEQHCWLLAVLVQKIHQDKSLHASPVQECSPSSSLDRRTWCLEQLCCAPWVQHLQPMFGGNATLAALHTTPPTHLLWAWFEQLASDNKWQCCADTLWALPEALLLQDTRLQMFNDTVMAELAATIPNSECPTPWWYCQHIGDISTQAKCILANMFRWPVEECIFALRILMESECRKLPEALETQVCEHLRKMLVYKKILSHFKSQKITSWFELSYFSENDPSLVMDFLLESELCLEWVELHAIPTRAQHLIDSRYFMLLLQRDEPDLSTATKLLHSLPFETAKSICDSLLVQLTSLPSLKFVISLLLNCYTISLGPDDLEHYKMVQSVTYLWDRAQRGLVVSPPPSCRAQLAVHGLIAPGASGCVACPLALVSDSCPCTSAVHETLTLSSGLVRSNDNACENTNYALLPSVPTPLVDPSNALGDNVSSPVLTGVDIRRSRTRLDVSPKPEGEEEPRNPTRQVRRGCAQSTAHGKRGRGNEQTALRVVPKISDELSTL
uniref:DUF547 domain-containing protein n=1 Tax=Timema douglasi TaxID=61478 RepID=A0A7R8Z949_TIMDO|nr:unnamed protein product [Timema douglasi]